MTFKSFNFTVILRLIVFCVATAGLTVGLIGHIWLLAIPMILVLLFSFFSLIYFLNGTNRKIMYFFDSITNDDTTLHYSEQVRPKSLEGLHKSLNRLNSHIEEIKLRNEHNEKFFHEMLKSSATGLIAVNADGFIEQINDAALGLIGIEHISHMDLLRQKNRELSDQMEQIRPGQSHTIKVLHQNELRLFSLKMALLNFGAEKYRLYSISDIRAELEENELDSWQKLIRVMTHEIMNSVAPITSLSNTLSRIFIKNERPLPSQEVTEKHVENIINGLGVIENTGKGLMRFVEDYRKLTRIPAPVFRAVQVSTWLNDLILLMQTELDKENVNLTVMSDDAPEEFTGDEKLLNQVMINIMNNALDALAGKKEKKINVRLGKNIAGRLKVSITDNGKGILPDETDKIFIPFYTTKEEGSGIGLSLCRKIMRLHKGSISVYSKPGEQTIFTLNF